MDTQTQLPTVLDPLAEAQHFMECAFRALGDNDHEGVAHYLRLTLYHLGPDFDLQVLVSTPRNG